MQKKIWILFKLDAVNPAYNIPFTFKLTGNINIDVLRESINVLFNRHFIIFSRFKEKDGNPYCEIIPKQVEVELLDYSSDAPDVCKEKVLSFIGQDSRKQFDLETGPLYRIHLSKQNDSTYFLHGVIHHIVFDGWSFSVFINDLRRIYDTLIMNQELKLEDVKPYYLDYARGIQIAEREPADQSAIDFWRDNLRDCSPVLNFPYDFPRKDNASGFGEKLHLKVPHEYTAKLKEIARKERATPFATLLSLLGVLFQRYSGENDICIGIHVANRPISSLERIFGMFVNTIPVRLKINDNQTFSSFINNTKDLILESIAHQELPFEKIVEAVNPERFPNVNPIFQVAVQWVSYSTKPMEFVGFNAAMVDVKEGISPFDITFNLWENDGQIEGEIEYNIDILKRDTIIRLADNFINLVQLVVENPDKEISSISIVSETDKKSLSEFNNTEVVIPDCLVQNLFEEQARIMPAKTAVVSGKMSLTYNELEVKSNQLARHLVSLGVSGGDVVGVFLERSVDMVVSVLGVLKAGCCYLPMDPMFPDERLSYMYEDSGAKVIISQSSLSARLDHFPEMKVVLTDRDRISIGSNSAGQPDLVIDNQSLAYIIYTSGSTGKPKGVKVHHQAVVNFLQSMSKRPGISINDRLLAVTTLSFDISVLEVFLPLSYGAELIVADTNDIFDGQKLSKLIELNEITVLQATPATWNILLSSGWKGSKNLRALCGGEAILPGLVKDLLPKVASLWDMYGPTETTVWSTCNQLTDSEPPILIGTPIDNTTIYIMDRNNKELPVGVIGEVCIGGLGVTKGYHNRPDLTAEKFITIEDGKVIYKTGDLGRFLADGNIELFGRSDNQIKLRGFRIEPGEIESLLSRLSGIKEAVVKVQKFGENDERLIAFLNVDSGFELKQEEITGLLSKDLPGYMIPSFFQSSEDFPRLPNGKINKKELIFKIEESEKQHETDYDSLTSTQQKLIHIWEDILKIKNINPSVSFFNNGGNSLLAINLVNIISKEFEIPLSLPFIFEFPTLKGQSDYISGKTGDKDSMKKNEIVEQIKSKKNVNFKKRY
jgi:polyketide synthase PksJ